MDDETGAVWAYNPHPPRSTCLTVARARSAVRYIRGVRDVDAWLAPDERSLSVVVLPERDNHRIVDLVVYEKVRQELLSVGGPRAPYWVYLLWAAGHPSLRAAVAAASLGAGEYQVLVPDPFSMAGL